MRVATAWKYLQLAQLVTKQDREMYGLQVQIATGKRVNRPSDDPAATVQILGARAGQAELQQQQRVLVQGRTLLRQCDQVLGEMGSALEQVRDLLLQAEDSTLSPTVREALATQIGRIRERMVELGNSQLQGRYLFAGRLDRQAPLKLTGDPVSPVEYQGDGEGLRFLVGKDATLEVTVSGQWLFNFADASGARPIAGEEADLFAFLATAEQAVEQGSQPQLDQCLARLDKFLSHCLQARARVGVEDRRLDALERLAQEGEGRMAEVLSSLEDCDLAAALTRLRMLQVIYEATLGAAARAAALPSLAELGF
jgi:flagellar hook-associated protein 3 FlgL